MDLKVHNKFFYDILYTVEGPFNFLYSVVSIENKPLLLQKWDCDSSGTVMSQS